LTDELRKEGLARDVVRHIQQLRKDSGLEISDRIDVTYNTDSDELRGAIEVWRDYIMGEVQARVLERDVVEEGRSRVDFEEIGAIRLEIRRAQVT
jgi:isoleucyl-tRNA synthetase